MGPRASNGANGNEVHITCGPRLLRWAMWPMGLLFIYVHWIWYKMLCLWSVTDLKKNPTRIKRLPVICDLFSEVPWRLLIQVWLYLSCSIPNFQMLVNLAPVYPSPIFKCQSIQPKLIWAPCFLFYLWFKIHLYFI
jgi:hypothetical protein